MTPEAGTLYVVPMPLGNVDDLSPRARSLMSAVDVLACEDTRTTQALALRLGLPIRAHMMAYHDHNETKVAPQIVRRLQNGQSVALVSEAGTPLVSDPGFRLVQAAVQAGVPVEALPGPCAATTALSAAGIASDRFAFIGFPPRSSGKRQTFLSQVSDFTGALVLYEAPRRILGLLEDVQAALGDRYLCLAVNLTKQGQRFWRGTASQVRAELEALDEIRGEMTLVIEGASGGFDEAAAWRAAEPVIADMVKAGVSASVIRDAVSALTGLKRRAVYQRALALQDAD